ncbi:MAG: hypothetical protein M1282_17470 [Chloroflexi bacterium]|nr:hypothetical protein [Chloroflexota bacterium]
MIWGITPVFEKTAIQHTFRENPTVTAFGALLALTLILFPIVLSQADQPLAQLRIRWRGFAALGVIGGIQHSSYIQTSRSSGLFILR